MTTALIEALSAHNWVVCKLFAYAYPGAPSSVWGLGLMVGTILEILKLGGLLVKGIDPNQLAYLWM